MAPDGSSVVHVIPFGGKVRPDPAQAILEASPQVELFDEQLWCVPKHFFSPIVLEEPSPEDLRSVLADTVAAAALPILIASDLHCLPTVVCTVGAESVVHFGASPHLGSGEPIRQLIDGGTSVDAVGIRSLSRDDAAFLDTCPAAYRAMRSPGVPPRWVGAQVEPREGFLLVLEADVFDPALMPSVDRPVPGGLDWAATVDALGAILRRRRPGGIVLSGLRPTKDSHAADFLLAKLLYKISSLIFVSPKGDSILNGTAW